MGSPDTYRDGATSVQIKVSSRMENYDLGQKCPLEDGIYLSYEGAVAVRLGVVVLVTNNILTKWGDHLKPDVVMDSIAPLLGALREEEEKRLARRNNRV